jgi:hypothetical protein
MHLQKYEDICMMKLKYGLPLVLLFFFVSSAANGMYDPHLGRFCSKDPVGYEDGRSLYPAYFALSQMDPLGKQVVKNWPSSFDPDWLGSSGCIDYCRNAGIPDRDCYEYCDFDSLPDDWPAPPIHPEWPIWWGDEVPYAGGFDQFPMGLDVDLDDGAGACRCVFPPFSRMIPANVERPDDGPGTGSTPGTTNRPCVKDQVRVMRFPGRCIYRASNPGILPTDATELCDCFDTKSCVVYIVFQCRQKSRNVPGDNHWVWDVNRMQTSKCKPIATGSAQH